jgi:hypothetical protein
MMKALLKVFACAAIALLLTFHASYAGTIIKLDLGGTGPDVTFSGGNGGILSTVDHNPAGLVGDQATSILYTDFLSSMVPNPTSGSYSLSGATALGAATPLGGGVFAQNFSSGNFKLYDSSNVLLLDVDLGSSLLVGGGNGAFFSITNGTVVGGLPSLTSQLVPNSIGTSMTLTSISGGGLSTSGGFLKAFQADATNEITATQVPEPATILLAISFLSAPMFLRRRR